MRIAIDARGINWYNGTGIGTYTENVLSNMLSLDKENKYNIYWSGYNYDNLKNENSKIIMASKRHQDFFQDFFIPKNIHDENIDIYHVPQNGIGLSENIACKKIVTLHDIIPYIMPETVGTGYLNKFLNRLPSIIQMADSIITVSQCSKKDILRFFPMAENKVFVTPLAADTKFKPLDKEYCRNLLKTTLNITKPFILYIGGFSPRKNARSLIHAFSNIIKSMPQEMSLVLVGSIKDEGKLLNILCTELQIDKSVIFTGFQPENMLPILYNAADMFVYPSLYEGFGLPPLEAMSCGTPVITSNISSIPEVTSDAALLIPPNDTSQLSDAIVTLASDKNLQRLLSEKGLERSKKFSWKKTSIETLKIYEKTVV